MNGHFLPKKSKFVFLNNSIEPYTERLAISDTARRQKVPASPHGDNGFLRYHKFPTASKHSERKIGSVRNGRALRNIRRP